MLTINSERRAEWLRWVAVLVLLALTAGPAAAQGEKPVTIEGQLKDTDPLDKLRKQSYHKVHEVELKKDQVYLIELRSGAFDTFLRVEDAQGKKLAENDDISATDLNSRLGFVPTATAKYRLVVTSFQGKQTGKYGLRLQTLQPAGEAKLIEGKLTKDSLKVQGRHTQVHKVQVLAGRWYLIDLISKEFDPYLILRDGQGKVLAQDDDSGGDLNARLLWFAEKGGEWLVQVLAFEPGTVGAYAFRLRPYEGPKVELTERERSAQQIKALNQRAVELYRAGKAAEAVVLLQQDLSFYDKVHPNQNDPDLALTLNGLAVLLNSLGRPAEALPHLERALAMGERLFPKQDHPALATTLSNLGVVLHELGQPAKALPYCERALAMCERLLPKQDHRALAACLSNLGGVLNALGQPANALPRLEQALAMCERLYPKQDHPDLALTLSNLGGVLRALGQPAKALPHLERALPMCERLYPRQDHPALALCLNGLGVLWHELGQPAKALPYCERALAMCERLYPKQDHPALAQSLTDLLVVLDALGQPAKALPYAERALVMRERLYPQQDHPDLAASLTNLGGVLIALGQPAKALPYDERALAMRERLYPKQDHPDLTASLNNLGGVLIALGQPAKALPYHERALAMRERLYPKQDHPDLTASLNNLGGVLNALGQPAKALPYHERALAMCERLYPEQDHPDLARCLNNLGFALLALGQPAKALPCHERALAMYRNLTDQDYVGEAQALARAAAPHPSHDACLSIDRDLRTPTTAYQHLWASKAAITRILQGRHAAARLALSENKDLKADWDKLLLVRGQLTFWLLNPGKDRAERDREVRALTREKEELERRLGKALPELSRGKELDKLGPPELLKRLPAHSAFIDIIRYEHHQKGKPKQFRYVAFLLPAQGEIQRIELDPADSIDLAVDLWRQAISGWLPTLKPAVQSELEDKAAKNAAELRRLVWEPLTKHLPRDITTVYLAPDGNLARFAFAALPGSKPGTILLEELTITYVPHGPFLLERLVYPPQFPKGPGDALLVGGVRYDPPAGKVSGPWQGLKATTQEVGDLKGLAAGRKILPLAGLDASTRRLQQELPKVRYAHLATHGFFDADGVTQERKRLREQLKFWALPAEGKTTGLGGQGRGPLVYTGVVLAGANAPATAGPGGGVLSGEMIVDLPLEGLRLAVLSACETGLGELTAGDAVQNLQLAFHLAGCPDVVASLWQVNDRATAALMAKFYHELWVKDRPPAEALRAAQLFVYLRPDLVAELAGDDRGPPRVHETRRQEVLERGVAAPPAKGVQTGTQRTPTRLWAAFVLSGTGR